MISQERYTDKLAKYILMAAGICIVAGVCWYFKSVLTYILIAVIVSLIAKPVFGQLRKVNIKGYRAPDWFLAALSLLLVLCIMGAVVTLIFPLVYNMLSGISVDAVEKTVSDISVPLAKINDLLRSTFPKLGSDFRIEILLAEEMEKLFDTGTFTALIGTAANAIKNFGIGLFSVVFIGFFFIKDNGLFTRIVCALVPDKHEETTEKAITDIGYLLSRYFIGVMIEVCGVAVINFLGLYFIARMGFNISIAIAFITGITNIIPYVGPLIGGVTGTLLGLIMKYSSAVPIGLNVEFLTFTIILIAIFAFTQLIDNMIYQPVIYSTSIKATPLEIFIVLLIAGRIAGPLGMIIAIPTYTVFRVIAFRFFSHLKAIKRLIPDEKLITAEEEKDDE